MAGQSAWVDHKTGLESCWVVCRKDGVLSGLHTATHRVMHLSGLVKGHLSLLRADNCNFFILTANLLFGAWVQVLGDERLTGGLLDRPSAVTGSMFVRPWREWRYQRVLCSIHWNRGKRV